MKLQGEKLRHMRIACISSFSSVQRVKCVFDGMSMGGKMRNNKRLEDAKRRSLAGLLDLPPCTRLAGPWLFTHAPTERRRYLSFGWDSRLWTMK